jgi:hypothetical protein
MRQVSVSTCYQKAVQRINNIHDQNKQYSLKAEAELELELNKNNHYQDIIAEKRLSLSSVNGMVLMDLLRNRKSTIIKRLSFRTDKNTSFRPMDIIKIAPSLPSSTSRRISKRARKDWLNSLKHVLGSGHRRRNASMRVKPKSLKSV